jgi:hypothetical protein
MEPVFLSEMCASPIHGGGITLQRVLGEDLNDFRWFVKVVQYTSDISSHWPDSEHCVEFPFGTQQQWLSRVVGCTLAYRFSCNPWVRWNHAAYVANQLIRRGIVASNFRLLVCPQGDFTLYTMQRLSQLIDIPYVTWVMDDHLVHWSEQRWTYRYNHEALMRDHLQQAEQVFVISPELQNFYRQRFGIESQVLFGPCMQLSEPIYQTLESNAKCRLAYFGSVGPWQQDALEALLPVVSSGLIELDLFTNSQSVIPASFKNAGVNLRQSVSPEQVAQTMRDYDAVVLPISFRPEMRHMSCFNIATKMAECLGSGVPTLVVGPADAAMVKFLEPYDATVIVKDASKQSLIDGIARISSLSERSKVLNNAQQLVFAQLSQEAMRRKWEPAGRWLGLRGAETAI